MEKNRQYVGSNKANMKSLEPKEVKGLSDAMNYQQRPSSNFKKSDAKVSIIEQNRYMLKPRLSVDLNMQSQKSLYLPCDYQNDLKAKIDRYQSKYVLNSSRSTAISPNPQRQRCVTTYNSPNKNMDQELSDKEIFEKWSKIYQDEENSMDVKYQGMKKKNTANLIQKDPEGFYIQSLNFKKQTKVQQNFYDAIKSERLLSNRRITVTEVKAETKQPAKKKLSYEELEKEKAEMQVMYESGQVYIADCQITFKQLKEGSEKKDGQISQLKMELKKQKIEFEQSENQKQIRQLKESIKTLEKKNEDLEKTKAVDIEYHERPLKLKISELEKIIKDKQNQISSLTSAVKRNEYGVDLARGKNYELEQKVFKLEKQIQVLEKRVSGHQAKLTEANKKQVRLNQQVQLLKAEAERKKKPVKLEDLDEESRKNITKQMDERNSLQLRYIDQMEGENQKLELQISALKKELNQLRPTKK